MHPGPKAILLCCVVAFAAGWLTWRAGGGRRSAEHALATLAAREAELRSSIAQTEIAAAEVEKETRQNGATTSAITAATRADVAPVSGEAAAYRPARSPDEIVASDPALQTLSFRHHMAWTRREHAAFYHLARLSPQQVSKFEAAQGRYLESLHDLVAVGRMQDASTRQTIANLKAATKAEYDAARVEAFGPEGYRQWREYLRTRALHQGVTQGLAGVAVMAGVPLAEGQIAELRRLTLIVAKDDGMKKGADLRQGIDWQTFDTEAKKILTPEQFHVFTTRAPLVGIELRWDRPLDAAIRKATNSNQTK